MLYSESVIAGSSNGRTAAFEAVSLGSNPSPRATSFASDVASQVARERSGINHVTRERRGKHN